MAPRTMDTLLPSQMLLIKAALLKGREARDAWEQWRTTYDIDLVGPESYSLLPQVYKNLQAQGVKDSLLKKLKGIYRHTWCKNSLLVKEMVSLLRSLENAGVSTLPLNSTMMSAAFTGDFGFYPFERAEIVIPKEKIGETIKCFQRLGWSSWATAPDIELCQKGTLTFKNSRGHYCVIRLHVLETYVQPIAEQYFWCHLAERPLEDSKIYVLTPTAYLLKLLVDGTGHTEGVTPRWVTEVYRMISLYGSNIDWDELFNLGKSLSLTFPLKHHLKNVVSIVNPGFSEARLQNIEDLPTSKMEALEYAAKLRRAPEEEGLLSRLSVHWCQYVRMEGEGNMVKRVLGFAKYLKKVWDVDHILQLPIHGIFRSVRRMYREGLV